MSLEVPRAMYSQSFSSSRAAPSQPTGPPSHNAVLLTAPPSHPSQPSQSTGPPSKPTGPTPTAPTLSLPPSPPPSASASMDPRLLKERTDRFYGEFASTLGTELAAGFRILRALLADACKSFVQYFVSRETLLTYSDWPRGIQFSCLLDSTHTLLCFALYFGLILASLLLYSSL